jgi:hypothetical protein
MGVIMGSNIVLATIGSMHNKGLKWLSSQPIPNILRHITTLPKNGPEAIPTPTANAAAQ